MYFVELNFFEMDMDMEYDFYTIGYSYEYYIYIYMDKGISRVYGHERVTQGYHIRLCNCFMFL